MTYLFGSNDDRDWHPYYYQPLLAVCNNPDSCEINYVLLQKYVRLPAHPFNHSSIHQPNRTLLAQFTIPS